MNKKNLAIIIFVILIISTISAATFFINLEEKTPEESQSLIQIPENAQLITKTYNFSSPTIQKHQDYITINIKETDFQSKGDGRPVIPTNLTTMQFPLGTEILKVKYQHPKPQTIDIEHKVSYSTCSTQTNESQEIYQSNNPYPQNFVTYHTGGGLLKNEYKTFFNLRINPVTYIPASYELKYISNVTVHIIYQEPTTPPFENKQNKDLLIITPEKFERNLQPLVEHKQKQNIQTQVVTVEEIQKQNQGRDLPEKIKYQIKNSIETYGIKNVLLFGGRKYQLDQWTLPVRYSHVKIREDTQEMVEPKFISDLYYADIYNSQGEFSSWDTNNNNVFAEYDEKPIDQMDLYPDVKLGRLPCRNRREARIIVNKIIQYENNQPDEDWFKKILLISGDHWKDPEGVNEGKLIMEEASRIMNDFKPEKLIATEENTLLVRHINQAINQGAGFAYFCGHGGTTAWGIHYPPDATGWAPTLTRLQTLPFYFNIYMNLLRNRGKLPVTIVGGCFNGKLDTSMIANLKNGQITTSTNCWAWQLTSHKRGGSIATIANTALGTHAMTDSDYNQVNDYLEIYDGWLELKFFKLYQNENMDILGQLHQEAITHYLNRFLGNQDEMDIKMAQQWLLFGDPTLQIGGAS